MNEFEPIILFILNPVESELNNHMDNAGFCYELDYVNLYSKELGKAIRDYIIEEVKYCSYE